MTDGRLARGRRSFEYHCYEGEDSADAELWHHTHQRVEVLCVDDPGTTGTQAQRAEAGQPRTYHVRFGDGFEATAFEDELVAGATDYYRPDYRKAGP